MNLIVRDNYRNTLLTISDEQSTNFSNRRQKPKKNLQSNFVRFDSVIVAYNNILTQSTVHHLFDIFMYRKLKEK